MAAHRGFGSVAMFRHNRLRDLLMVALRAPDHIPVDQGEELKTHQWNAQSVQQVRKLRVFRASDDLGVKSSVEFEEKAHIGRGQRPVQIVRECL